MKLRLDRALVTRALATTRSQAESLVKLGQVKVNGQVLKNPEQLVKPTDKLELLIKEQYVSRAALKLASVAQQFKLDFKNTVVLDVGSSTGGFTDFALRGGAKQVIAVDVGSHQMHPKLRTDPRLQLHEQTDIRNFKKEGSYQLDIVLVDVSFISLTKILIHIKQLLEPRTQLVAMTKPQFETQVSSLKNQGVIKNERVRRQIIKQFEGWVQNYYKVIDKADSKVSGQKGNLERFYLLKKL